MGWHRRDGTGTRGRNTSKAKYKGQLISRLPDVGDGRQRVTQSAYYRNGQVKTVTDAKGQIVESSYDRANRVVQTRHQHADGSLEEIRTFAYNKVGKPTRVTDLNGATEYVYDELYRVVEERRQPGTADVPPAPSPYSVQSRYDANGNRTKCIYPDTAGIAGTGRVLVSFYDRLNRLTRMEDHGPQASLPAPAVTQYSYDANGNRLSLSLPNGVVDRYEYDSLNRVTAHSSRKGEALIYDCEYRYDLVGNRLRIDETLADADLPGNPKVRHLRYAYDQQYRLVLETWAAGNIRPPRPRPDGADGRGPDAPSGVDAETRSYTFDRAGNRLTMVVERPGATETIRYRYDDLNRLLSSRRVSTDSAAPPEETGYSHDINGNRQTKTVGGVTAHYTWDVNDRLVAVDRNGRQVFAASYDYRTRRLSKSERQEDGSLKTTVFRYDQGDSFQEFEGEAKKVEFVRGSGMGGGIGSILYSERAQIDGGVEYFHFNAVGHTVATSNASGTVQSSNLYEAYGGIVLSTGSSENNRLANTKERDFSIGLDNHGFRYFDPEVGRYVNPDPLGYKDGPNTYLFTNNNPINHVDPLGLETRRHHLLALDRDTGALRKEFERALKGSQLGIHDFCVDIEKGAHDALHGNRGGEWLKEWREFMFDKNGKSLNRGEADVYKKLHQMANANGIDLSKMINYNTGAATFEKYAGRLKEIGWRAVSSGKYAQYLRKAGKAGKFLGAAGTLYTAGRWILGPNEAFAEEMDLPAGTKIEDTWDSIKRGEFGLQWSKGSDVGAVTIGGTRYEVGGKYPLYRSKKEGEDTKLEWFDKPSELTAIRMSEKPGEFELWFGNLKMPISTSDVLVDTPQEKRVGTSFNQGGEQ